MSSDSANQNNTGRNGHNGQGQAASDEGFQLLHRLPAELFSEVYDHLPAAARVTLGLTSRQMYQWVGGVGNAVGSMNPIPATYAEAEAEADDNNENARRELLTCLERASFPRAVRCDYCEKLHAPFAVRKQDPNTACGETPNMASLNFNQLAANQYVSAGADPASFLTLPSLHSLCETARNHPNLVPALTARTNSLVRAVRQPNFQPGSKWAIHHQR